MRSSIIGPREMFAKYYQSFGCRSLGQCDIWFDVDVEVVPHNTCTLIWSSDFVIQYLKPVKLNKITIHPWCQSIDLGSGSRVAGMNPKILYCQLYMSEKNLFYQHAVCGAGGAAGAAGAGVKDFSSLHVNSNSSRFLSACDSFLVTLRKAYNSRFSPAHNTQFLNNITITSPSIFKIDFVQLRNIRIQDPCFSRNTYRDRVWSCLISVRVGVEITGQPSVVLISASGSSTSIMRKTQNNWQRSLNVAVQYFKNMTPLPAPKIRQSQLESQV